MARSNVVSVKRVGGVHDHASRSKVFGPDANTDTLVCGSCRYGEAVDWTPTMKKSQCPACGNRDGHEIRGGGDPETENGPETRCRLKNLIFKTRSLAHNDQLEVLAGSGWEIVGLAPYRMGPDTDPKGEGTLIAHEYLIMLRKDE
jgi:hypothetical protein